MASVGKTFSIKELKSRLDENELDLSLSELRVVPVQELSHPQLSKVTSLDLSDNKLSTLPDAFCSLTNLCRLNLSSNQLRELPDDFGNLVNVVHLDLYRNKLEDLPASMHRMRSLKWLDLKDNPLDTELARAAGQCLDEKQCKIAAQNVLKYLASVQARIDRAKNKKAEQQKAEAAKERALEEEKRREVQAKKRREKEQRKNENRQKFQDAERKSQVKSDKMNGSPPGKSDKSRAANKTGGIRAESAKSPSVILKCCKLLFQLLYFVFIMGVCTILVTAAAFYSNCTMGHKWIPKSEPLCRDFFSWASTGETPPTVRLHAQMTLSASAEAIRSLAANATKHDYAAAAGNLYEAGRRLTVKTWDRSVVLYHERISPAMSNATVIAREYALVAGHYLTVGLDYAIGFAVIGFHWLIGLFRIWDWFCGKTPEKWRRGATNYSAPLYTKERRYWRDGQYDMQVIFMKIQINTGKD